MLVPLLAAPSKFVLQLTPQNATILSHSLYLCSTFIMQVVHTSAVSQFKLTKFNNFSLNSLLWSKAPN
jgi:hypothetical protein